MISPYSANFQSAQRPVQNNNHQKKQPGFSANIKFQYDDELFKKLGGMKLVNITNEFQKVVKYESPEVLDDGESLTFVKKVGEKLSNKDIKPLKSYIETALKDVGLKAKDIKKYVKTTDGAVVE